MAVVASRSVLVGALLRATLPSNRMACLGFLRGLSRDELECLAEFHGACIIEKQNTRSPYRLLADFFDPATSERWQNADDRAHKTFIVLTWLDQANHPAPLPLPSPSESSIHQIPSH